MQEITPLKITPHFLQLSGKQIYRMILNEQNMMDNDEETMKQDLMWQYSAPALGA